MKTHRQNLLSYQLSFWKNSVACPQSEATDVKLEIGYGVQRVILDFDLDRERGKLAETIAAVKEAYRLGELAAKEEIRQVLGIKESN